MPVSTKARDKAIADAIAARKIPATSRDNYVKLWDADPTGTLEALLSFEPGVVPIAERSGPLPGVSEGVPVPAGTPQGGPDDYNHAHLTPPERERIARAAAGSGPPRIVEEY